MAIDTTSDPAVDPGPGHRTPEIDDSAGAADLTLTPEQVARLSA